MVYEMIFLLMLAMYAACVFGYGKAITWLDINQPNWWMSLMMSDYKSLVKFATCKYCLSFWTTALVWLPLAHAMHSVTYLFMVALIFFITASNTGLLGKGE